MKNYTLMAIGRQLLYTIAAIMSCSSIAGCGSHETATDDDLAAANEAITNGNSTRAKQICGLLTSNGLEELTEQQLGQLAILYMKLSEYSDEEENVAEATECLRMAMHISADSLASFSASLPLEDQSHFILLKRVCTSLDHPVDLNSRHSDEDTEIHIEEQE